MNDHENCVNKTDGKSWCGKDTRGQWAFVDMKHAKETVKIGSVIRPCKDCMRAFEAENQKEDE